MSALQFTCNYFFSFLSLFFAALNISWPCFAFPNLIYARNLHKNPFSIKKLPRKKHEPAWTFVLMMLYECGRGWEEYASKEKEG